MERIECDRMFIAVMETGSFTAAAQRLNTSHGQASKLISRLERELGVNLLRRSTRSLTPTEVGHAYYQQVRQLIADYDALNDSVRNSSDSPSGVLRLSAPVTFGTFQLPSLLIEFAHKYPEIELDVRFADRVVNVVDEGFDLALRIGKLDDSSLVARKLSDIRIVIVAAPDYLSRRGTPSHWEQLTDHDCVVDTNFRDPYLWPFMNENQQVIYQPVQGRMKFSNAEVCLNAAISGLGITRLPSFVVSQAIANGQLQSVLTHSEAPALGLYAVYPPAKYLAHKSRVLIDFLIEAFAGQPKWDMKQL